MVSTKEVPVVVYNNQSIKVVKNFTNTFFYTTSNEEKFGKLKNIVIKYDRYMFQQFFFVNH